MVNNNEPLMCCIASGEYTGDGTTSQGITGLGFQPRFVWITPKITSSAQQVKTYYTTDKIIDDHASGMAIQLATIQFVTIINAIISLDADGFTVDDNGTDADPNKNTQVYNYIALG